MLCCVMLCYVMIVTLQKRKTKLEGHQGTTCGARVTLTFDLPE